MPWPTQHKAETRERILAAAAAALREKGPEGVSVADVMDRVGLTHGGFYSHFRSKDELLAHALQQATEQSWTPITQSTESAPQDKLGAAIATYLSPWHLTHTDAGCPVAALAPELARGGGRLQRDVGRTIRSRLAWMRALIPKSRRGRARSDAAAGVLACMVGGLVLARAVGGEEGAEILSATRRFLATSLED